MCELMGLAFQQPISADFSIREFGARGEENPDGWGLAWYPDRAVAVVKEPLRWGQTPYVNFLENYPGLRSSLYIAHVRHRTIGGEPTYADTHPFVRELNGREYCFAHNGTLRGLASEPAGRYRPVGGTDSERAFCHLMDAVARRHQPLLGEDDWRWLHGQLAALNDAGQLNCLLSDGDRLFCYHDRGGYKGLTFRRVRMPDLGTRRFEDAQWTVDLAEEAANEGFVIATCPLSPHAWRPFRPGELLVLEGGQICFSSHGEPARHGTLRPAGEPPRH
jgi:predicted glutamine amidotransferase